MNGDLDQPAEDEGMFEPHKRLKLDGDRAVWREVGEEVVVLDVETATYLSLNGSGGALWKRLDAGATLSELVAELVSAYGVPEAQASKDVEDFLSALRERSLLLTA
jgi:ribosomal protein S16